MLGILLLAIVPFGQALPQPLAAFPSFETAAFNWNFQNWDPATTHLPAAALYSGSRTASRPDITSFVSSSTHPASASSTASKATEFSSPVTSFNSTSTDLTSTEPISTETTSTEPTSTEPTSTQPTSTDPISTDPISTDPISTEPTSTEPTSTESTSTEPTSTEPSISSIVSKSISSTDSTSSTVVPPHPSAVDITDFVETLLDDTKLFHNISESHLDTIDICKSYAFDTSQINYHISKTDEFLRNFTAANQDRKFFQKNGLIATLAFDYLGENNFRCAIGLQNRCVVRCPQVVDAIEDLETARRVYFALTSASNFLAVANMVHDGMIAAQGNVGLMANKMSYDYYWWHANDSERSREMAYQFFMSMMTWTAQQAFNSIVPVIPWKTMQDYLVYRLTIATGKSYSPNDDGRVNEIGQLGFQKWKGDVIGRYMNEFINPNDDPDNLGTYMVPPQHGGHYKFNPSGPTFFDWCSVNLGTQRLWQRWVYGETVPMDRTAPDTWLRHSWNWFLPDFRRRVSTQGWGAAGRQMLTDTRELMQGTARYIEGKWWYFGNSVTPESSQSKLDEDRHTPGRVELGDMSAWNPQDQWRQEFGPSTDDFLLDVFTRSIPHIFPDNSFPQSSKLGDLSGKLDLARTAAKRVMPILPFFALPLGMKAGFDSVNYHSSEGGRDQNLATLAHMVQASGRASRKLIQDRINALFMAASAGELTNLFAMGSFLPADRNALGKWTASTLESTLTKSLFLKTVNLAWKTQRVYITCTPHLISKPSPNTISLKKSTPENFCENDNAGPQNMKACIQNNVCYLYKWNDRGFPIAHHNEAPFGLETLRADPWNVVPRDIITSSYLSAKTGLSDLSLLGNTSTLAYGPDPEFLTQPTTPGLFTIPICTTPKSWAGPVEGYNMFASDANTHSAWKSLPCYCGALGADTRRVWEALRLDTASPAARHEYIRHLCPRQINAKLKEPLERYIALCRLGVKRRGGLIRTGQDGLCEMVISVLEHRKIESVEEMEAEVKKGLMCIVETRKWWRKKECGKWWDGGVKVADVWDVVAEERSATLIAEAEKAKKDAGKNAEKERKNAEKNAKKERKKKEKERKKQEKSKKKNKGKKEKNN